MKQYIKPKITIQKIKMSFFLTNINFIDSMNLVGDIYAQSANTDNGNGGCVDSNSSTNDGSVDTVNPGNSGTNTNNSSTNNTGPGDCISSSIEANGDCALCSGIGNCFDGSSDNSNNNSTTTVS